MPPLEVWLGVGSTYSYLTVMRAPALAAKAGVTLDWRPFSVRAIMQEMDNIPFATKPVKAAYMWRDIERRAAGFDLPVRVPAPYPLHDFDRANRIAVAARSEGWCEDYLRESYRLWFQEGVPAGSDDSLTRVLPACGQDIGRVLSVAGSAETQEAYDAATDAARGRGIFGAPSFVTSDGELFWGDDRLEEAIAWHKTAG
ncbi:2-hydroxychromene-2-carboxylate isomerase [Rhodosalinus halophilus]|uniref:2-hydroxychromene-2-carboxylate isomerase n=1 Tax=Rhodosalinus halophilus TaxID=2259333 RepID=A0A365U7X7_9RHOB|nr:DsbA family protein [Rhodosalinus halophilus]RBI84818.1 2-hydroxychromene-2-carboxylate isomerase [Rhodosalinus halophilus]